MVGPASGDIEDDPGRGEGDDGVVNFRGSVQPLQAVDTLHDRWLDVGAGYQLESVGTEFGNDATRNNVHGPYLQLDVFPVPARDRPGASARIGVRGSGELLLATEGDRSRGFGSTFGAVVEWTGFTGGSVHSSASSEGANAGLAYGEGAIGMFLGAGHRAVEGETYWVGLFGVTVRIPFVAGVACCLWPGGSDDDSDSEPDFDAPEDEPPAFDPLAPPPEPPRRHHRTPADPKRKEPRTPADPKRKEPRARANPTRAWLESLDEKDVSE